MAPRLVHTKLWRYAFVWRYDTANRKPHARKQLENYAGPNEFTDFEKFDVEHTENTKTIFGTNWTNINPVTVLLFGRTALRVISLPYGKRERAASGPRQGRKKIRMC